MERGSTALYRLRPLYRNAIGVNATLADALKKLDMTGLPSWPFGSGSANQLLDRLISGRRTRPTFESQNGATFALPLLCNDHPSEVPRSQGPKITD